MNETQFHFFFVLSFLAAGLTAFLAVISWRHRTVRGAREFTFLMVSISLWTFAVGWGMITSSIQANFIWAVIRMAMVFCTPIFWLAFALQFSDHASWLKKPNMVLLSIVPLTSLVLMATTQRHKLFLTGIDYLRVGPYLIDEIWHLGPWFWVHLIYSYALILIGDFFLLQEALHLVKQYRRQTIALVIGTLFPLLTNIAYTFHLIPGLVVNYDPFGFVLAGLAFSFGLFQYRMFDLKPVARQLLIDSMGDGMLVVDDQLRIVDLNPAALKIFNSSEDTLVGQSAVDVFATYADVKILLTGVEERQCELTVEQQGQVLVYDLRCSPIFRNNLNVGRLCVLRDITQQKNLEDELQEMAMTDALTGLYNRRQFYQLASLEYDRASRYHSPFALLMIDLDNFKQVNDAFGHLMGDRMLQALADTFRSTLRKSDIIFRYGGDEFAVLMPLTGLEEAIRVSKRLGKAESEDSVEGFMEKVCITLSQGLALFDGYEDVSLEQLLADADRALYVAKAKGKNHLSISGMD
ncbi:MAG: diguanylate cyclase [Anaerolineaceae bacterium]|nr:diguanylate cyclase [Anaerolineaceae bacterium]